MVSRGSAHTEAKRRFGSAVRYYRLAQGLTLIGLAERAGLSDRHLGDIERGIKSPTLEMICAIAFGLDLIPSRLFDTLNTMADDGYYFGDEL